jgi:hypothetical protein
MNKATHDSALKSLDDAINKWPRRKADLMETMRLHKESMFGPLIRRIYELIPDKAKPIMDHYFFFSYGDKSMANDRIDFAKMFEERLWAIFGLSWITMEYEILAKYGCPDEKSLKALLVEMNTAWDGILSIYIMELGTVEGEVRKIAPICILPINPHRDENSKEFFEEIRK